MATFKKIAAWVKRWLVPRKEQGKGSEPIVDDTPSVVSEAPQAPAIEIATPPAPESSPAPREEKPEKLLWYPKAKVPTFRMPTKGKYSRGYPRGLVIHWVWAPQKGDPTFWAKWGKDECYTFMTLGYDGTLVQAFPLDEFGAHAGESNWPGVGARVSRELVGVEVVCEGMITRFKDNTYGNEVDGKRRFVDPSSVRHVPKDRENIKAGYYQKFTTAQEMALVSLCLWLKRNNPEVFDLDLVLGHDEVAGPKGLGFWRKTDPGGSLSMTMPEFREFLKKKYREG